MSDLDGGCLGVGDALLHSVLPVPVAALEERPQLSGGSSCVTRDVLCGCRPAGVGQQGEHPQCECR